MGLGLRQLTPEELRGAVAQQLGVGDDENGSSIALLAAVLRRTAASACPCPRDAIVDIAAASLQGLDGSGSIKNLVREMLDRLVVIGDLLELGNASSLPGVTVDDWLYCARPTFVVQDNSILILGVEAEDQAAMPPALRQMMRRRRELRFIPTEPGAGADIRQQLVQAGYLELSKAAWMRLPTERTAAQFKEDAKQRLKDSGGMGDLEGLTVIGPPGASNNFKARWTSPGAKTGYFVGRRPQAFGAPIWVFVELAQGRPTRFIDLPWSAAKFRGCDLGWRIQSALDTLAGVPQSYRTAVVSNDLNRYEFFSPLPLWIERRLQIHGEKIVVDGALIAYELACDVDHAIDDLLQSRMWFTQLNQEE